jgi:ActR/RegA family two-component response regulator
MKILLADDDRDQLAIREMLLAQYGFDPIVAGDRESALQAASAQHPNCAVVDLKLPDMKSGLQLIRELKAIDADLYILVLTGANHASWANLPERRLVHAIIQKGAASTELIRQLKMLQGTSQRDLQC